MTRLIKKYKNRRLYDTEISKYITVEQLRNYVIEGTEFRVEDSLTKADITNETLLQTFVEMEAQSTNFFSTATLRQLICLANHPLSQQWKTLIGQFFSTMEQQINSNPLLKDYQKSNEAWNKQFQQALKQWQDFYQKPS